jgi:hypothetical protein
MNYCPFAFNDVLAVLLIPEVRALIADASLGIDPHKGRNTWIYQQQSFFQPTCLLVYDK